MPCALALCVSATVAAAGQQFDVPAPAPGNISGTVTDVAHDIVPGATVLLDGPAPSMDRQTVSGSKGAFNFDAISPGGPYRIVIKSPGYAGWTSPPIQVNPGQFVFLSPIKLIFAGGVTSIVVRPTSR